jgi:hypothetical protein
MWKLSAGDPLSLRLAADARLGPTDYGNDQIWELSLRGAEPAALALRTTYGLRCREARIFAGFREAGVFVLDPASFPGPVEITRFYVNYIEACFAPLPSIEVSAAYWAPDSHTVAGVFTITNEGLLPRRLSVQLASLLRPAEGGEVMGPTEVDGAQLLAGRSGGLCPVLLTGGPDPADLRLWPSLVRSLDLEPGQTGLLHWVQCAEPTLEQSLARARALFARRPWEGDFSRIELVNAGIPQIESGDPDWDAAFAFAYKVSLACYLGPTQHLPHPSFVFLRVPDRGYSRAGDGSDHAWQWNGQVATEAYVNVPIIAPAAPELAKGIVRNYLAVQADDGFIDWKPGLAGQRERALCMPLLAAVAWIIYEYTEDREFLREVYPGLRRFFEHWFRPRHDRDGDGVPEWSHTIQSAFDDNPSFVRWQRWAQGADITQAEAPDLVSYLYREAASLAAMARLLELEAELPGLQARQDTLRQAAGRMWRDATALYHYVDRDTHEAPAGEVLGRSRGDLSLELNRRFAPSARVLVRVEGPRDARPPAEVRVALHGRGRRGRHRIETLKPSRFQWYWGLGTAASEKTYAELERVEVRGLDEQFEVTVATVDFTRQDQTLLLPLWGGPGRPEQVEALVRRALLDESRFWRPYGIPNCSAQDPAYAPDNRDGSGGVWMMWNTMLGEGLVEAGYRDAAAELIRRLMAAMVHSLKTERAFREAYNSDALEGLGGADYIWGVAPAHLYLKTVGIRILSRRKVWVSGYNPFPGPVTVRAWGVSVTKAGATSVIVFPSDKEVVVTDAAPQFVEDE